MRHGKNICESLKQIRLDIARANDIDYNPTPCDHEGDCAGTCPACEGEVRYLERELSRRRSLGKTALVAGVSLGLALASTSCHKRIADDNTQGIVPNPEEVLQGRFVNPDSAVVEPKGPNVDNPDEVLQGKFTNEDTIYSKPRPKTK